MVNRSSTKSYNILYSHKFALAESSTIHLQTIISRLLPISYQAYLHLNPLPIVIIKTLLHSTNSSASKMKSLLLLHPITAFCTLTNAYKLNFYSGQGCRSQSLGNREMKADGGCQREFAGNGASVSIKIDENNKDSGSVVIFFEGDDCKPSNIMQNGGAFVFEDGCWTGNYGSYEVWDLWKQ
jgi:hypothetical protein